MVGWRGEDRWLGGREGVFILFSVGCKPVAWRGWVNSINHLPNQSRQVMQPCAADALTATTATPSPLQAVLYREMRGRIKEEDASVATRWVGVRGQHCGCSRWV